MVQNVFLKALKFERMSSNNEVKNFVTFFENYSRYLFPLLHSFCPTSPYISKLPEPNPLKKYLND